MTWLTLLPYLLSIWTMLCMYTAGHNPRRGWTLALFGQLLWLAYTFAADAWGFLPLNVGLTWVYARNLMRAREPSALDTLRELVRLKRWKDTYTQAGAQGRMPLSQYDEEYAAPKVKAWAEAARIVDKEKPL